MNEKLIWDFLYSKIQNPYGVAGLMGNLYIESKLNPKLLQSSYARNLGISNEEYTKAVDEGSYLNFSHDNAGYGLAQWTYWSRKEALYAYAKAEKKSIGDLNMQLEYLWSELQGYKTVVNTLAAATSVREASDVVAKRYERPKDQSEAALKNRANYGQQYYDQFAQQQSVKRVETISDKVNVRTGNSTDYSKVDQVKKGSSFVWIATAENGWHAIKHKDHVYWISGEHTRLV